MPPPLHAPTGCQHEGSWYSTGKQQRSISLYRSTHQFVIILVLVSPAKSKLQESIEIRSTPSKTTHHSFETHRRVEKLAQLGTNQVTGCERRRTKTDEEDGLVFELEG